MCAKVRWKLENRSQKSVGSWQWGDQKSVASSRLPVAGVGLKAVQLFASFPALISVFPHQQTFYRN